MALNNRIYNIAFTINVNASIYILFAFRFIKSFNNFFFDNLGYILVCRIFCNKCWNKSDIKIFTTFARRKTRQNEVPPPDPVRMVRLLTRHTSHSVWPPFDMRMTERKNHSKDFNR